MEKEKFYEKKNFGIPVTILIILAYLIGYSLIKSLAGTLIAALLFAAAVFLFNFDERVKNAVKHSYVAAILFLLVYFILDALKSLFSFFSGGVNTINSLDDILYNYDSYIRTTSSSTFVFLLLTFLVDLAVIVYYAVCIIFAMTGRDVKIDFILSLIGEQPKKNTYQRQPYGQQRGGFYKPPVNQAGPFNNPQSGYQNGQPNPNAHVDSQVPPVNSGQPGPQAYGSVQGQSVQSTLKQNDQQGQEAEQQVHPQNDQPQHQTSQASDNDDFENQNINVCPNCGRVNNHDASFCSSCGMKLR